MIHLSDLLKATGARPLTRDLPERFARFCTDHTRAAEGDIYVAMDAEGHSHSGDALEAGASAVICEDWSGPPSSTVLIVPDTPSALRLYAEFALRAFGPKVVLVGSSSRESSIAEMLSRILSAKYDVFRGIRRSMDSVEASLAIGDLHPGHEVVMIDQDISADMGRRTAAALVEPHVCVLPPLSNTHGEPVDAGRKPISVVEAFAGIVRDGGTAVLAAADSALASAISDREVILYGDHQQAKIGAIASGKPDGPTKIIVTSSGISADAALADDSLVSIDAVLSAATAAAALDMAAVEIATAISGLDSGSADGSTVPAPLRSPNVITVNADGPVWLRIDLDVVTRNVEKIVGVVGPDVEVMAVIKADAYGHGARRVAAAALEAGASRLGVSRLNEVPNLRAGGIHAPVVVLGHTRAADSRLASQAGCELAVFDGKGIEALDRAAASIGRTVSVHLKIDTGMGRLGAAPEDAPDLAEMIDGSESLELRGTMTHFGRAAESDRAHARGQLHVFDSVLADIRSRGIDPGTVHAANTAAAMHLPESRYDMVRCGIAIYGLAPSADAPLPGGFAPALTMSTRIAQVKRVPAGTFVSYGSAGELKRDSTIAVVGAGYGDGVRRAPQTWGPVLVRGKWAEIIGNVCMEMFMIDVTDIPGAKQGDEVVLIGSQGGHAITADEAAARAGTISYEILAQLLPRAADGQR